MIFCRSENDERNCIEKRKVVFILPLFDNGGAEKSVSTIAEGLSNEGYAVCIIIIEKKIELEFPENVEIKVLGCEFEKKLHKDIKKIVYLFKIKKLISTINPDIIFSVLPYAHKITAKAKFRKPVYYIININLSSYFSKKPRKFSRDKEKIKKLYYQKDVIAVTDGVKDDILNTIGVIPKTVTAIYDPFDIESIRQLSNEHVSCEFLGGYIVSVANFNPVKRHDVLIRAYKKANIEEVLVLIGEGQGKREIVNLIDDLNLNDKVILLGWVKNPYPYIKNAKALILSSDSEGMSRVLIEALILGTPAVSTDCKSGPSEILTNELKDFLSPIGDISELANNINKALTGYPEITEFHIEKFKLKNLIQKYINIIEEGLPKILDMNNNV